MKNSSIWTGILRRCIKIRRKEDGSTAMEFALVMPVMLLILFGIIEFGSVLFLHNNMLNAARGAARRMAVAEMTAVEAEALAGTLLANWSLTFTVVAQEPDPLDPTDNDVVVTVTVPIRDATITNAFGLFPAGTLSASVTMRKEG